MFQAILVVYYFLHISETGVGSIMLMCSEYTLCVHLLTVFKEPSVVGYNLMNYSQTSSKNARLSVQQR